LIIFAEKNIPGQRHRTHSVHSFQLHLVWIMKYRYPVLVGDIQLRCRKILCQVFNTMDIQILKGVVNKDHFHLHASSRPQNSIRDIVKCLKGRSSRMLLQECHELGAVTFEVLATVVGVSAISRKMY